MNTPEKSLICGRTDTGKETVDYCKASLKEMRNMSWGYLKVQRKKISR